MIRGNASFEVTWLVCDRTGWDAEGRYPLWVELCPPPSKRCVQVFTPSISECHLFWKEVCYRCNLLRWSPIGVGCVLNPVDREYTETQRADGRVKTQSHREKAAWRWRQGLQGCRGLPATTRSHERHGHSHSPQREPTLPASWFWTAKPPEQWEIHLCCFEPPICGVLLQQSWETNISPKNNKSFHLQCPDTVWVRYTHSQEIFRNR